MIGKTNAFGKILSWPAKAAAFAKGPIGRPRLGTLTLGRLLGGLGLRITGKNETDPAANWYAGAGNMREPKDLRVGRAESLFIRKSAAGLAKFRSRRTLADAKSKYRNYTITEEPIPTRTISLEDLFEDAPRPKSYRSGDAEVNALRAASGRLAREREDIEAARIRKQVRGLEDLFEPLSKAARKCRPKITEEPAIARPIARAIPRAANPHVIAIRRSIASMRGGGALLVGDATAREASAQATLDPKAAASQKAPSVVTIIRTTTAPRARVAQV
jgi:hypothetical protein